jgi:MoxR-like ATPase
VFPRDLLAEVIAALDSGRHIMLTGSPGTGKTSLAYAAADLAREAMRCTGYVGVTVCAAVAPVPEPPYAVGAAT